MKSIQKLLNYSLSDLDIKHIFKPKKMNIILYQDLNKYKHIDDLFKKSDFSNCFLFFPENEAGDVGHWIGILKHSKNSYEYFDPYRDIKGDGIYEPDEERKWLNDKILKKLHLEHKLLTNLFLRSGINTIVCNPYPFQQEKDNISTCGKHVACRLMHSHMTIDEYWKMVEKSKENPDIFVCNIIYKIIKK